MSEPNKQALYMRNYRLTHPDYRRIQNERKHNRNWSSNNSSKKWQRVNPEKKYAEQQAYRHVPLGPCCMVCGTTENLERAHIDYSKPLEVLTFCAKHHRLVDKYYKERN